MLRALKEFLSKTCFFQWIYPHYKRLKAKHRFLLLGKIVPHIYARRIKRPIDPRKVLFLEIDRSSLSDNFQQVYAALEKAGDFTLRSYCLGRKGHLTRSQRKVFVRFLKDLATAKALFLCIGTDLIAHVPIRKETTVTQLWHGCGAFKRFGLSVGNLKFGAGPEYMKEYPFYSHYSLVTVSSPEVVWAYAEAMGYSEYSGVIQATGVSRTDVFFDEAFLRASKEHVLAAVPQIAGKRVLMYAPTFRGQTKTATSPNVLDLKKLRTAVGEDSILLIKHHPHVKCRPAIPECCQDFAFDVTDVLTIEDLICVSDLCISDYSSLIFEYSLFERPMVFFAHDLDDYFDWRGFYYDYKTFVPGPIAKTTDELITVITHPDIYVNLDRVRAFRQKYMSACDGHATERILNRIGLLKARPKNVLQGGSLSDE